MALKWEVVASEMTQPSFLNLPPKVIRAKVPGGWFVKVDRTDAGGAFFYPDPEHTWDGSSLP